MTGLQLALIAGAFLGLGASLFLVYLAPTRLDLTAALERLATPSSVAALPAPDMHWTDRSGMWVASRLPTSGWLVPPATDLALLNISVGKYYGRKFAASLVGLLVMPTLGAVLLILGYNLPLTVPVLASLLFAVAMWWAPDLDIRKAANHARQEFRRALVAYFDLVALERLGGSGTSQALTNAAGVGESWVFRRLQSCLTRARLQGIRDSQALDELAEELGIVELHDVADIVGLADEQGTQIYRQLRARASSLRNALMNDDLRQSNAISERMSAPTALLTLIFVAILATPAVVRLLGVGM